jgi:relaxase-like protein/conjugative element/phage-associated large polyvalent protein/DNA relaxase TraI-like protein/DNA primase RepB-like protein
MIVKKVPTSKLAPAKSKANNVRALADYIAGPKAGGAVEKVEYRGALNLLNLDHEEQVQEMIDLAELAKRSPQPVQHWIMSWREGEQPTLAQGDEAARMFLAEMGLAEHQAIFGLHRDTENWHLHLAINRVHPDTERLATVNNGFDHEVAHRAIARVEHTQGWQREDRGLFRVQEDGRVQRERSRRDQEREPSGPARDFEERVGARSAERIAIEDGAPAIRGARSWRQVHEVLAEKGMSFEQKGSGAILWVGDQPVKASGAGRDCSMSALQKRLGDFEPAMDATRGMRPARAPEAIMPRAHGWQQYIQARSRHYEERAANREQNAEQQRDDRGRMADRHREERTEIFRGSWKGRGDLLNAARSVLAARQAQEKAEQRDRQRLERGELYRDRGRFPSYEEWLRQRDHELAQEWRHRERRPAGIEGPRFERPTPQDIRAFDAHVQGWHVHYRRVGERGSPAFTDRGREIDIYDSTRRESVLAALQLSAQKWGTFTVRGNERFQRMSVELAAEHGFKIANPELQQTIAAERERLRMTRGERAPDREHRSAEVRQARTPAEVYRRHLAAVTREHPGQHIHPSRVDAEIAVRMRLAGHHRGEIVRAIKEAAPALRPGEKRNWDAYVKRTVDVAFGVPGDRLAEHLGRQNDRLCRLEGRHRDEPERLPPGGPLSRFGLGR